MGTQFTLRHYVPETDLPTLSRMLTEVEAHDHDGENTSEEYLRSMETWPNFDPDKNIWVAEVGVQMVGFGQILPKQAGLCSASVTVHPSWRQRGLGSQLFDLLLKRTHETQSKTMRTYANGYNHAGTAFLLKNGFSAIGQSGALFLPVAELPAVEFPTGYSLRRYRDSSDAASLTQALNACYRGMWGHQQEVDSADGYVEYYGREGIHLLFDPDGDVVSVCAAKPAGKQNERGISDLLDAPGVVQQHRHEDFQRPLVLAVMHWLRKQGERSVTLEFWGETEKALQAYRDLGFTQVTQLLSYQKELA